MLEQIEPSDVVVVETFSDDPSAMLFPEERAIVQ
jgi:hypothetical protein